MLLYPINAPYAIRHVSLTLLTTDISGELLTKYMLPGLRQLLKDTQLVVPQQEVREESYTSLLPCYSVQAMVQDLLHECEMKCNEGKSHE